MTRLQLASVQLAAAGVDNPQLDARLLLQAVTGLSRTELLLRPETALTAEQEVLLAHLLGRRAAREPVARILGQREFWGLPFTLGPETLEPRPDSETLVEAALGLFPSPAFREELAKGLRILDLGTGTGCLLAAVLQHLPQASGVAVDVSLGALETARENFDQLGLAERVTLLHSDWWQAVIGKFDLILSNPPYLTTQEVLTAQAEVRGHDPHRALDGGADGLCAYRTILAGLPAHLATDGLAILELGVGQAQAVSALAQTAGLQVRDIRRDLGGIERALVLQG